MIPCSTSSTTTVVLLELIGETLTRHEQLFLITSATPTPLAHSERLERLWLSISCNQMT